MHRSSIGGPQSGKLRARSILFNENISQRHDAVGFNQSSADVSVGSDAAQGRARRVTAAMLLVRSMLQQTRTEDGQEKLSTVVESLEEAIMTALLNSANPHGHPSPTSDGGEFNLRLTRSVAATTIEEGEETKSLSPLRFSTVPEDSDSSDSESAFGKRAEDMPQVVTALQKHLFQGTNLATLAGLLTSNTFSLKDRRVDQLFGDDIPLSIRKLVITNMVTAIEKLWERLGWLLLEKLGSFEKAFRWLDKDGSGTIDRAEFIYAYVTLHLASSFTVDDDEEGIVEIGPDGKKPGRRSTLFEKGALEKEETDFNVKRAQRGSRSASVFAGSAPRRSSVVPKRGQGRETMKGADGGLQDARLRRMVLKADAEFLFHMMHAGERGLAMRPGEEEDEDNTITMQHLVMRVTGLDVRSMEHLREEIQVKCGSLHGAFLEFSSDRQRLRCEEFTGLYHHLFGQKEAVNEAVGNATGRISRSPSKAAVPSLAPSAAPSAAPSTRTSMADALGGQDPASQVVNQIAELGGQDLQVTERALRIFKGIDVDGSGNLSLSELRHALAPYAPATTFSIFRRRVLLQYGSFEHFVAAQPAGGLSQSSDIEAFAFEFDMNAVDGSHFAERLGILAHRSEDDAPDASASPSLHPDMPTDHFSVEEFAIVLFLVKQEGSTMEEFLAKLGRIDRDKDMHFREFQDRIGSLMQARAAGAKAKAGASPAGKARPNARASTLPNQISPEAPMSCRAKELRAVYEMLEREHRRVSVNILLEAMKNVSDCLAIDRSTYQTGDHIICRIRLSADQHKRSRERPFIAVVPERLKWQETGSRGQWLCEGNQVQDLTELCGKVHEVPRGPNGLPRRESWLRIIVPGILACAERYEVRIFASSNGKEPGKQIGRSVAFDLLMPRPESPLVDQVSLETCGAEEATVVLHWTPPPGNFKSSPITSYIVHVEPLIYRHEISVDKIASARELQDESDSENEDDDDTYKQIIVWSPKLNGFLKKLSYRIHGLQRGVQYRFGIQCVHATTNKNQGKDPTQNPVTEVRGALSELSDVITMPLYHVTSAPGQPQAHQLASGVIELAWAVPVDEDAETNRIFQYLVQYRHARDDSQSGSDSGGRRDSAESAQSRGSIPEDCELLEGDEEDSDRSETHHDGHEGASDVLHGSKEEWLPVSEKVIFIGQPQWLIEIGWVVPCHIPELMMIDGVNDNQPHEFRICAVNNAGKSAWSDPSEPIQLRSVLAFQTTIPPPVEELELLDVEGCQAPGKSEMRSQCRVCWELPAALAELPEPPKYALQVRDTSPTLETTVTHDDDGWREVEFFLQSRKVDGSVQSGESRRDSDDWESAAAIRNSLIGARNSLLRDPKLTGAFQRDSFLPEMATNVAVEALVLGLERFPASAVLELRVQTVSPGGASSATVEIPPVTVVDVAPPSAAPKVLQLVSSMPPIVELGLPASGQNGGSEPLQYVLQASYATELPSPDAEEEPNSPMSISVADESTTGWSDFVDVDDIYLSLPCEAAGGLVKCLARDFGSEYGFYRFRVCAVSMDGVRSTPSSSTEPPFEFTARDQEHATTSKPKTDEDARPKRPREIQVVRAERGWCELTWEQRVAAGAAPPSKFEVQECREDATNSEEWRNVRALYVSAQEAAADSVCFQMSAAVFFAEEGSARRSVTCMPRWKVRVRADGSDWSPTPWQELTFLSVPPKTSAPSIVKSELYHYLLQWTVPEGEEDGAEHELQLQWKQTRRGGVFSDWVPLRSYSCRLKDGRDDSEEQVGVFWALVDRHDVLETAHVSPESEVRFRVRLRSRDGVCGAPSEPSDATPIQMVLSPVPAPRMVNVIGQGRILMDAKSTVQSMEYVRLEWPLPSADEEGDSDILDINYHVEMYEEGQEFWTSVLGAFMGMDREAHLGTALLPLMTDVGVNMQHHIARFRVVAQSKASVAGSRNKSLLVEAPATHSEPSAIVSWGGPMAAEAPPLIVLAQPMLIVLQFRLPAMVAHLGPAVSAMLELCRDGQDLDEDDGASSGSNADLEFAGEHPVYWQLASHARHMSRSSICITEMGHGAVPIGMELAVFDKEHAGTLCEGAVMINSSQALSIGDRLRARLRVCPSGMETADRLQFGVLTQSSRECVVEDTAYKRNASLRIEYPCWTSLVPVGTEASFRPRLSVGCMAEAGAGVEWREEAPGQDGCQQLQFHVAGGNLPAGLTLDVNTGMISGMCAHFEQLQSFTVHASVQRAWHLPDRSGESNGSLLSAGAGATTTLACAAVESKAHSTLRELLDSSLLEKLHERGGATAVGSLLNSPEFLPIYEHLSTAAAAAAATPAEGSEDEEGSERGGSLMVRAVHRLLSLPEEIVQLIHELGEEDLILRLYGSGSEESESSQTESESEEEEEENGEDDEEEEDQEKLPETEELMPDEHMEDIDDPLPTIELRSFDHLDKKEEQRRDSSLAPPNPLGKGARMRRHSTQATPMEISSATDSRLSVVLEFGTGSRPSTIIAHHLDGAPEEEEELTMASTLSAPSPRSSNCLSPGPRASPTLQMGKAVSDGKRESVIAKFKRRHSNIIQASMAFAEGARSPLGNVSRRRQSEINLLANVALADVDTNLSDMDLSKFHSHGGEMSGKSEESRRGSLGDKLDRRTSSRLSDVDADSTLNLPKKHHKEDRRRSRIMSQGNVSIGVPRMSHRESPAPLDEEEEEDTSGNRPGSKTHPSDFQRRRSMHVKAQASPKYTKVMPRVDITYPGLTPLWPAFVDVEFTPVLKCVSVGPIAPPSSPSKSKKRGSCEGRASLKSALSAMDMGEQALEPGQLKFSIEPLLPAQVILDETTGVISGSAMREHVAGSQYTISAHWTENGELAGRCAIAFAVVSTDLASICNRAYLEEEPPAFRPPSTYPTSGGQESPPMRPHTSQEIRPAASQDIRPATSQDFRPGTSPEEDLTRLQDERCSSSATADSSGSPHPHDLTEARRGSSRSEWRFSESRSESRNHTWSCRQPHTESPWTADAYMSVGIAGASSGVGARGPGAGRSNTPGPFMVPARPRSSTPVDHPVARPATSIGGCFQSRFRSGSSMDWCPRPASRSMMTDYDDRGRCSPWKSRWAAGTSATPDLVKSRTKVFPLGPPLKDRDTAQSRSAFEGLHIQPWSAR